jgi:hypothetical protein
MSLPWRRMRKASALILEDIWTEVGLKLLFRIPSV